MRRTRVFHTESFRLAAWFAVLFLALASVFIYTAYRIVDDIQTQALIKTIDADISTINNGYKEKGLGEAIEIVQQRLGSTDFSNIDLPGGYILLQDGDSGAIAGNLAPRPARLGLFSLPDAVDTREPRGRNNKLRIRRGAILGRGVMLSDDLYLYVGRDTTTIATTRARILQAFAWITGTTVVLAVLGGMFFSVQFMRRIDDIIKTCDAIVAGNFKNRIQQRGSDNELDRLSAAINSMLDRIATLLDNLQQVSSDIAHDLRTPLTHLRQRLENARARSTTLDEYSSAVANAIGDTDQLLRIFGALLRISQVEAGTRADNFSTLSLSALLRQIVDMFRPVAEDHGHVLECHIRDGIDVCGDTELLTQLVVNLLENALRHTPIGTKVSVDLSAVDGNAVLAVSDTGPGIPEDERDKVFRRFYRLSASRGTPGNGLGLALVQAIANLHQAGIVVSDNQPGLRIAVTFKSIGSR